METIGKLTLTLVLLALSTLLSGFVLMKLYGWFVVPLYNLSPITWIQAYGLSLVASFLLLGITANMKNDADEVKSATMYVVIKFFTSLISYATFLLIGYIAHLFI